jgi:hypothetical protein
VVGRTELPDPQGRRRATLAVRASVRRICVRNRWSSLIHQDLSIPVGLHSYSYAPSHCNARSCRSWSGLRIGGCPTGRQRLSFAEGMPIARSARPGAGLALISDGQIAVLCVRFPGTPVRRTARSVRRSSGRASRAEQIHSRDRRSRPPAGRPASCPSRSVRLRSAARASWPDRVLQRSDWTRRDTQYGCHPDGPANSSCNANPPAHLTSVRVCGRQR